MSFLLSSVKDNLYSLQQKGVYSIPCSCAAVYIGRYIKTRLNEHKRCLRTVFCSVFFHSTIAEHLYDTGNQIVFESSSVIVEFFYYYSQSSFWRGRRVMLLCSFCPALQRCPLCIAFFSCSLLKNIYSIRFLKVPSPCGGWHLSKLFLSWTSLLQIVSS